jgi:hypothetical protein
MTLEFSIQNHHDQVQHPFWMNANAGNSGDLRL